MSDSTRVKFGASKGNGRHLEAKQKNLLVRMLTWCSHGTKVNKIL